MIKNYIGLSGWEERGHEASCVLVKVDGDECEICAAAEEERFIKERYAFDVLPKNALQWCLRSNNLQEKDISKYVFSWDWNEVYTLCGRKNPYSDEKITEALGLTGKDINYVYEKHHLCHAASAFYPSGFEETAVIVLDGQGEKESGSIWIGKSGSLELVKSFNIVASLGYFYEAVSSFVGFANEHGGKTMGLAGYGEPKYKDEILDFFILDYEQGIQLKQLKLDPEDIINISNECIDQADYVIDYWIGVFENLLNVKKNKYDTYDFTNFPQPYCDLAASCQSVVVEIMKHIVALAKRVTKMNNLCLAGGVFLNCMANGELSKMGLFENLFVQPAANDAGAALGAALIWAYKEHSKLKIKNFSPLLGVEFQDAEIIKVLKSKNVKYEYIRNASKVIAKEISEGRVVAVFQGRMEYGPRALGNRSIIASPDKKGMRDYINIYIKAREVGRPLGPSIIDIDVEKYFGKNEISKYMTFSQSVLQDDIKEIIHIDGTTRPNIVTKEMNSVYYQQLQEIRMLTGKGIVLNTSFNYKGPIINEPVDAVECFLERKIDMLVFNNRIIIRKEECIE